LWDSGYPENDSFQLREVAMAVFCIACKTRFSARAARVLAPLLALQMPCCVSTTPNGRVADRISTDLSEPDAGLSPANH
jgi:hypothetical protein